MKNNVNQREVFYALPNDTSKEVIKMSDRPHHDPNCEPNLGDVHTQRHQLDEETREDLIDQFMDRLFSAEGDFDPSELERRLDELDAAGVDCGEFDVGRGLKEFHERFDAALESGPEEVELTRDVKKSSGYRRPLARIAIIAAALCAFVFTAQASGLDILGAIARWTSEQFAFVKVGEEKENRLDSTEFASLREALEYFEITEKLSPTVFPENAEVLDITVKERVDGVAFSAAYLFDGEKFQISIRRTSGAPFGEIEINDSNVEIYPAGGIEHHIMTDVKQIKATWKNGSWECFIAGNISRNDLVAMIDSIYE